MSAAYLALRSGLEAGSGHSNDVAEDGIAPPVASAVVAYWPEPGLPFALVQRRRIPSNGSNRSILWNRLQSRMAFLASLVGMSWFNIDIHK